MSVAATSALSCNDDAAHKLSNLVVWFASLYLFVLLFELTFALKVVEFSGKVAGSVLCLEVLFPDLAGEILTKAIFSTDRTGIRLVEGHFFIIELQVFTVLTAEPC